MTYTLAEPLNLGFLSQYIEGTNGTFTTGTSDISTFTPTDYIHYYSFDYPPGVTSVTIQLNVEAAQQLGQLYEGEIKTVTGFVTSPTLALQNDLLFPGQTVSIPTGFVDGTTLSAVFQLANTGHAVFEVDGAGVLLSNTPPFGGTDTDISYQVYVDLHTETPPTVTAVTNTGLNYASTGHAVTISVNAGQVVNVIGAPLLHLNDNEVATYTGGSGTDTLIFTYVVNQSDNTSDLQSTGIVLPSGAAIDDASGAAVSVSAANDLGIQVNSGAPSGYSLYNVNQNQTVNEVGSSSNYFFVITATTNSTIYGGDAQNIVSYSETLAAAGSVTLSSSEVITISGSLGTQTLNNIQEIQFTDGTLIFNEHSAKDLVVYELYQAAFARTPDQSGFLYWAHVADTTNTTATQFADYFISSGEFTQKYGNNVSNTAYVTALYSNVLGRAPDSAGLNYWEGQANSGEARDQLLVAFATSQENVNLIAPHISHGYWTT